MTREMQLVEHLRRLAADTRQEANRVKNLGTGPMTFGPVRAAEAYEHCLRLVEEALGVEIA